MYPRAHQCTRVHTRTFFRCARGYTSVHACTPGLSINCNIDFKRSKVLNNNNLYSYIQASSRIITFVDASTLMFAKNDKLTKTI